MVNVWTIIIIVLSSLLKGITGFGFALVSLPLLMMWYTPKEIIPVLMMCNLLASFFIILQKKSEPLVTKPFRWMIISGGVFTIFGVLVLKNMPEVTLVHITAILAIVFTLLTIVKKDIIKLKLPKMAYYSAGALIGFLTGTISVSGPPLALFLNIAKVNNQQFREIFAWFNVVAASVAVIGYWQIGLIHYETLQLTAIFVPILLAGTIIGKRLNGILPYKLFRTITLVVALVASSLLLVR